MTDRVLVKQAVGEREKPTFRHCPFCGRPCRGRACTEHRDLIQIEHAMYSQTNEPNRLPVGDQRPGSPIKGV